MIEFNRSHPLAPGAGDAPRVKIVGIGGAGSNALDRVILDGMEEIHSVAMNTDVQALGSSVAPEKVQLGRNATRGLGAGGDPELGLAAADEAIPEIRQALDGAAMVFLCVGLGGGTGSGAAPLIAELAREQGSLVVIFATMPFAFEGKRRNQQAEAALAALQETADVVICFENDRMGDMVAPTAGIHQAFAGADQTVSQSIRAICNIFRKTGLIHIGFDDLAAALRSHNSRCLFGFGEAEGDNRAHDALARALKNPLMEKGRILSDTGNVLVNITGGPGLTLNEVQILMQELGRHIHEETRILFGAAIDPKMGARMNVTIISSIGAAHAAAIPRRTVAAPAAFPEAASHQPPPPPEVRTESPDVDPATEAGDAVADQPALTGMPASAEPLAPIPAPVPRPKPVIRPLSPIPDPVIPPAAKLPQQETLQFEPVTRGRFEKSEPTIVDGEDLDVPTFRRRNVKLK